MNSRIEGDIDLTQNLDFYRKKPKMLLPKNVDLGEHIKEDNSDAIFSSSFNGSITYYNNDPNRLYIYNYDDSSLYPQNTISLNLDTSDYNTAIRTTSISDNSIIYTISSNSTAINSINFSISNDGWTSMKKSIKRKSFNLWDHIDKILPINLVGRCSKCHKLVLFATQSSKQGYICKCKSCENNKELNFAQYKYKRFIFNTRDRSEEYEFYDIIPWENYFEDNDKSSLWTRWNYSKDKRKIPWLRELDTRVYDDYIEDLKEEQDYSSYLTNMGWIGIRD